MANQKTAFVVAIKDGYFCKDGWSCDLSRASIFFDEKLAISTAEKRLGALLGSLTDCPVAVPVKKAWVLA